MLHRSIFILLVVGTAFVASEFNYVTCGSVLKLKNGAEAIRLHSHEVKYGSGSGQQSVTGTPSEDDVNSHWQVVGVAAEQCSRGTPVKCGQQVRLYHLSTQCYLHSHDVQSPLSKQQEVSCFGKDGTGDSGDNWEVVCDESYWEREAEVTFKHVVTEKYLANSGSQYGRPIEGQREIVGTRSITRNTRWVGVEGVYMGMKTPSNKQTKEEL
uniref:Stromal cell-derived factor 2 n=1 Tax=Rhabditophanes sp. KR3021 TaxID=114890 RepID=A0AC35U0F8_9BILA